MIVRKAEIVVVLPIIADVLVSFAEQLEVSLDCSYCQRTNRTVIFEVGANAGTCIPGSAARTDEPHPPYPGQAVALRVSRADEGSVTGTYDLEYQVSGFEDAKYGPNMRPWTGHPTWGQVAYDLTCPQCELVSRAVSQSNIVRPYTHACTCGYEFFVERDEIPRIRWFDESHGDWQIR